jgi:Ras GTPase-activating-like protein IQGAP2/3
MDRSNSMSSNSSTSSRASSYDPFPYQTRLLERTSSLRSNGSLSRSNSQTAGANASILNSVPSGNHTVRKWNPTHRVSNSVDAVRGKWEERAKAELLADNQNTLTSRSASVRKVSTLFEVIQSPKAEAKPTALPLGSPEAAENERTPSNPRRYTITAPIVTSAYSSGTSVFDTQKALSALPTPAPDQVHSPSAVQFPSASSRPKSIPPSRFRRSNTVESISTDHTKQPENAPFSSNPSRNSTPTSLQRRPMSLYGNHNFNLPSPDKANSVVSSSTSTSTSTSVSASPERSSSRAYSPPSPSPSPSPMPPTPYKSSYMNNKKKSLYSDQLSAGRRLGRHLPRIVSGDAADEVEAKKEYVSPRMEARTEPLPDALLEKPLPITSLTANDFAGEVAGIPGRKRFSRDKAPITPHAPLPSSLLSRSGLWADKQRHLLLAYEYLCHVGEAQQWIEGCLGEELGFGVVELEEGLRNGVILAKLVRKFQGSGVVRRIYEVLRGYFPLVPRLTIAC